MHWIRLIIFLLSIYKIDGNEQKLPNILFILADDLGWANVGYHNKANTEVRTPNIDNLVANGLELNRHYASSGCSPSRAAMQSGRLPVHVTQNNGDGMDDPSHGIPPQMTGIASKMKQAGYDTHLVGKWDCGFSSYSKLPLQKGYDTFFGYLSKGMNYWTKQGDNDCNGEDFVDVWLDNHPAADSKDDLDREQYVEFMFRDRVLTLLDEQTESDDPFFMVYSMHLPHYPEHLPAEYYKEYGFDTNNCQESNTYIWPGYSESDTFHCRSIFESQVFLMDLIIGDIITKLKANNQYENTLIVFASDNGGSLELDETAANNWPLRGGKSSTFEGGVRVVSFVSGGYLPQSRRGQIEHGLMHIADWYTTFCDIVGVDYNDYEAIKAKLPNTEGLSMWPLISGETDVSPRTDLALETDVLIVGNYKLYTKHEKWAFWQSAIFPNSTTLSQDVLEYIFMTCSSKSPCLFDVHNDPSEYHDLANEMPDLVDSMVERLETLSAEFFENEESGTDSCPDAVEAELASEGITCGCWMTIHNYNYFTGPYQDLTEDQIHFDDDYGTVNNKNRISGILSIPLMNQTNFAVYIAAFLMAMVLIIVFSKYFKTICNKVNYYDIDYSAI